MRTIYLIRHGQTEPVICRGRCICRTDVPLSAEGRREAEKLGPWLQSHPADFIFSSPLCRCRETAALMAAGARREPGGIEVVDGLAELAGGLWEGRPFAEIRARFPDLYEARGKSLGTVAPPGGESFVDGGRRLGRVLQELLARTKDAAGDLVIVAHSGVIRGLLCLLLDWDPARIMDIPQPSGGITRIEAGADGSLSVQMKDIGLSPAMYPGRDACHALWERWRLPEEVRVHQQAVADLAGGWAETLRERGLDLDPELAFEAGLLHDIARLEPEHAQTGAKALRQEGYPKIAHIIRVHHGLTGGEEYRLTEASLVFLADKRMQGGQRVSLKERFERSRAKCRTSEAEDSWRKQYGQAMAVQRNLDSILGENA